MNPQIAADTSLRELALAIARNAVGANEPEQVVLAQANVTAQEYGRIKHNPEFVRLVEAYTRELTENGFSFSAKSRLLAESLLPDAYHMARDPDTPAAVRAKVLENLVAWGDLAPKKAAELQAGPGFSITINIPGATPTTVGTAAMADVVDTPALEFPTFPDTPARTPALIAFDEPDDYVYAGDDHAP